ncbi:MAG: CpsD/CapB family tyrosine-protein kinase [Caldicoprobacterales bacterium]
MQITRFKGLINNKKIKSPIVEAYKTLRTNIQFSMPDGGPRTMIFTSSTPAEGKSTTAANLAISIAQSNKRVLLVDGDLRKSVLHRIFELPNLEGLTNILAENRDYLEVVKPDVLENLDIITAGPKPPNPSELLGSRRMENFLEEAKKEYDTIIIDGPPVLAVTDAVILAPLVDGVVIVSAYGQATFDGVDRTKAMLERVDAKILGVVLNRIPVSQASEHYYYYYYEEDSQPRGQNKTMRKAEVGV